MLMDTAITAAVTRTADKIATLDAAAVGRLESNASLDTTEWCALGDKSSRAVLAGIIDQDTAQTLYGIHARFHSDATLAERIVFMQAMGEILPRL